MRSPREYGQRRDQTQELSSGHANVLGRGGGIYREDWEGTARGVGEDPEWVAANITNVNFKAKPNKAPTSKFCSTILTSLWLNKMEK